VANLLALGANFLGFQARKIPGDSSGAVGVRVEFALKGRIMRPPPVSGKLAPLWGTRGAPGKVFFAGARAVPPEGWDRPPWGGGTPMIREWNRGNLS